ncbi:MAG TPA: hypothetical protein VIU93_07950 [Gallionellaceae bacterium]
MNDLGIQQLINRYWLLMLALDIGLWLGALLLPSTVLLAAAIFLTIAILKGDASGRLVVGVLSWIKGKAEQHAVQEWQGSYYSWQNRQIRILEARDTQWVVAQDLVQAAGLKMTAELRRTLPHSYPGYRQIPGTELTGFDQESALKFLISKQHDPEIIKLKLWLEREVFGRLARQRQAEQP